MFGADLDYRPRTDWRHVAATTIAWVLLLGTNSKFVDANQNKQPRSAQAYDRAAMAVSVHRIDIGSGGAAKSDNIDAGATTLVCGSGDTAAPTANASCSSMTKGTGGIATGQDSNGG